MEQVKKEKLIKLAQVGLALLFVVDLIVHYRAMHHVTQLPTPVVIVQNPKRLSMAEHITQTGNMVAYNAVNLVARVEGYLDAIKFTDGTMVKKGQPLFVIEQAPYQAKLREANASVKVQQAAYAYAKAEYARQLRMYKENATSLNNVEKWLAQQEEAAAEVDKALANADIASINYSYTEVSAPFDGRIGRHLVDVGNLVGNGVATQLATVEQLDPIYVYFNLNELDFMKLRALARARGYDSKRIRQVPVEISFNGSGFNYKGNLDFVNTGLDSSTGTMEFRALMPNKTKDLVPGLFVQVRVETTASSMQLTVPNTAVLYDQIGPYLLVVDTDNKVVLKRVVLGSVEAGQQAITKGLVAEDKVIVSGLQNATPGNLVAPQYEKNPA
jgi:RND family efflux transporter MFP subunit